MLDVALLSSTGRAGKGWEGLQLLPCLAAPPWAFSVGQRQAPCRMDLCSPSRAGLIPVFASFQLRDKPCWARSVTGHGHRAPAGGQANTAGTSFRPYPNSSYPFHSPALPALRNAPLNHIERVQSLHYSLSQCFMETAAGWECCGRATALETQVGKYWEQKGNATWQLKGKYSFPRIPT